MIVGGGEGVGNSLRGFWKDEYIFLLNGIIVFRSWLCILDIIVFFEF